jgi:hypothetical protein
MPRIIIEGVFRSALFGLALLGCSGSGEPPSPVGSCASDGDCRTFSDYCTGCNCRALTTTQREPVCQGPGVRCLIDPCGAEHAVCENRVCVLSRADGPSSCAAILCAVGTTCVVENGRAGCR